ncbi:MAG: TetR/AcrR family transcriptional regulator [Actinocatenispora sp.]
MPTAFSTAERNRITSALRATALRLFGSQGLRRTSLDDLVRPAGIAKSTFYLFFDSKEALYLDLMLGRTAEVRRRVVDEALHRGTDTRDALRRFLTATAEVLRSDPLYRRLMTHPEEMEAVSARVSPAALARVGEDSPSAALERFLTQRRAVGDLPAVDPQVLTGVLRAVLVLPAHADELGPAHFPQILDLVIDLVATGLTRTEA